MSDFSFRTRFVLATTALLIAAVAGYVVARWTSSSTVVSKPEQLASAEETSGEVKVSTASLTTMGIVTEAVRAGNFNAEILAPGAVVAAPNAQAVVAARVAGTVAKINKRLGELVKVGEVLALVESRDAAAMAADQATAEARADLARNAFNRERQLFEQKITPRQDLEAAQAQLVAAEADAHRARAATAAAGVSADGKSVALVSPIGGRVTWANASLGSYVEPQTELFRVADPRYVVIEAATVAADAHRIASGDAAVVVTGSGATLDATVASVTPTVNEETRSATVTLNLRHGGPAPGEFVQVRITPSGTTANGVVIPEEAVQSVDGRDAVFVRTQYGFKVVPVIVGARSAGRASIASGLKTGDVIATTNAFLLKAEVGKGAEEEE